MLPPITRRHRAEFRIELVDRRDPASAFAKASADKSEEREKFGRVPINPAT